MKLKRIPKAIVCFIVTALAGGTSLLANPIVPANDGVGTLVNRSGNRFDITGGTQAGANLFHSLQKFGLSEGQIANFLSRPDILNVLTRVVGGETSVINGLIQLTGGNSNLFIMNPAGVVFGAGASVNVPASFSVTTANAIKVGNGYFSINTTPSELQQLTGTPNGFAFSNLNTYLDGTPANGNSIIINQGNLSVPEGQSIVLAGGVVINTGKIETPQGNILISATPDGKFVNISAEGSVLSYNLPIADNQDLRAANLRPFQGSDLANLVTNGTAVVGGTLSTASSTPNPASTIFLVGEQVQLQNALLNNQGTDGLIRMQVSPSTPVTGFVFLDRVRNYEQIANALLGGNQLILLNRNDSGTAKVSQVLANQTNIQALHFVGDGNKGQIWLGRDFITNDTLSRYSNELSKWQSALAVNAEILFYACNLAQTADGQLLLTNIKNLTGANVGASTDLTGNSRYGANWILEYGRTNTPLPFDPQKITTADVKLTIFTVTNLNDTVPSGASGELRSELDNANTTSGSDTVRFQIPGVNTISLDTFNLGQLVISDDTTFDVLPGVDITIAGDGISSRVFNLSPNTKATFDGAGGSITITGGFDIDGGGIFADTGSTLVLQNNVTITGNSASNNGGGIFADNSTVTVNGGIIDFNTATNNGGGISAINNTKLDITNVGINNNSSGADGGGIFANNSTVTVNGGFIDSNNASNNGGGIYTTNGTKLDITNVTVKGNFANVFNGGGIFADNSTVTVNGGSIDSNIASNNGGGIYTTNGTKLDITNVTVKGNFANVFNGGGIFADNSTVTVNGGSIDSNIASNDGGGIFADNSTVTVNGGSIDSNIASNDGGGIFAFNNSNVSITNAAINKNEAQIGGGGGIFIDSNSTATITGSKINKNLANVGGAGIANAGNLTVTTTTIDSNGDPLTPPNDGGGLLNQGTANITASTISRNNANNGGGIDNQGTLTITNSTIGNNTAVLSGGGMRNFTGATLTANNVTISGNTNQTTVLPPPNVSAGAIFNDAGATVNISNSIIAGNLDLQAGVVSNEVRNSGTFNSTGPNLVGENGNAGGFPVTPQVLVVPGVVQGVELGPLQVNSGGTTETFQLLPTSVAFTIPAVNGTSTDQYAVTPITFRNLGALQVNPPFPTSTTTVLSAQREPEQRVAEPSQPFLCTTESYLSGTEATSKLPKCVQNILFTPSKKLNDLLRN
jgi:filamentous hemagglutinin family protein